MSWWKTNASIGSLTSRPSRMIGVLRRKIHAPPPIRPTHKKIDLKEDTIAPILISFSAGFALTVATLYYGATDQRSANALRPNKYCRFDIIEARRANSKLPSDHTDGDHVYLKVHAPLSKEARWQGTQASNSKPPEVRILSVFMKEPSLQIERPYTPLYADALDGSNLEAPIELLIKRYPDGEVGKYAHSLGSQANVELRGPVVTWQGPRPHHFILIAGGTGITPAHQLLDTLIRDASRKGISMPRVTILYAAAKPSSLLLLPELASLQRQFPTQIEVRVHVDAMDDKMRRSIPWMTWLRGGKPQLEDLAITQGPLDMKAIKAAIETDWAGHENVQRKILVCGPDGMVEHVAGRKQGRLQGSIGGILGALGCQDEEVWKL